MEVLNYYTFNETLKESNGIKATQLTLTDRMFTNLDLIMDLNEKTSQELQLLQDSLLENFQIIFYCAGTFLLCQTITLAAAYKHFLGFSEKIILIVTRIN